MSCRRKWQSQRGTQSHKLPILETFASPQKCHLLSKKIVNFIDSRLNSYFSKIPNFMAAKSRIENCLFAENICGAVELKYEKKSSS